MVTFTSCRSFLTRLAGSEIRTLARSVPSTFSTTSRSTTLPVSRPAIAHRAADAEALRVAEDDVDRPLRGQEAGSVAGQADQADQAGRWPRSRSGRPRSRGPKNGRSCRFLPGTRPIEAAGWPLQGDGGFSSVGP